MVYFLLFLTEHKQITPQESNYSQRQSLFLNFETSAILTWILEIIYFIDGLYPVMSLYIKFNTKDISVSNTDGPSSDSDKLLHKLNVVKYLYYFWFQSFYDLTCWLIHRKHSNIFFLLFTFLTSTLPTLQLDMISFKCCNSHPSNVKISHLYSFTLLMIKSQ